MDQQAASTFTGIMMAFIVISAIGLTGYGLYYWSQADERRAAELNKSMDRLRCATENLELANRGIFGRPCD